MNLRKLRRIARERTGRPLVVSYRTRFDFGCSEVRRLWVISGNFWRIGTKTNFQ